MKRWLLLVGVAAVSAAVVATSAMGLEVTVTPSGIGKVRVGMTRSQVQRLLGRDALLDQRTNVAGKSYAEYGWDFGSWSVGFLQRGRTLRVAQVSTTLRAQRTTKGIGVGSSFKAVARAYPQAVCRNYYVSMRSPVAKTTYGSSAIAIVVASNRQQLAFLVRPVTNYDYYGLWSVYQVVVRHSIPGALDYVPKDRCDAAWRLLGRPHRVRVVQQQP